MGGPIVGSQVRLDLDDAAAPPDRVRVARIRIADERCAEERRGGREGAARQDVAREDGAARIGRGAQRANVSLTSAGKTQPRTSRIEGMIRSRMIAAVTEPSNAP